jgi:dihydrodipicolinate synthase/N-acetylneuraminate lyase
VYSRANGRLKADTLAHLAEQCPSLVALKDGAGDTEELWAMRFALGDAPLLRVALNLHEMSYMHRHNHGHKNADVE